MIRSIMVPLDGSRFAETALPAARALARSAHADLRLVLVRGSDDETMIAPGSEERYLEDTRNRVTGASGIRADYHIRQGPVAECLRRDLREMDADLVVMATRARGTLPPPDPGSVAEALAQTTPTPMLLVTQQTAQGMDDLTGRVTHPRSLLTPVDVERAPGPLPAALIDFACLTQSHVTLLNVVEPDETPATAASPRPGRKPEDRRWRAQKRLDRLADQLRARGVRTAARVVIGRDVAEAILDELARGPADLVAMSPRPRTESGPAEGVTQAVVRGATKPVLVLPPACYAPNSAPTST